MRIYGTLHGPLEIPCAPLVGYLVRLLITGLVLSFTTITIAHTAMQLLTAVSYKVFKVYDSFIMIDKPHEVNYSCAVGRI